MSQELNLNSPIRLSTISAPSSQPQFMGIDPNVLNSSQQRELLKSSVKLEGPSSSFADLQRLKKETERRDDVDSKELSQQPPLTASITYSDSKIEEQIDSIQKLLKIQEAQIEDLVLKQKKVTLKDDDAFTGLQQSLFKLTQQVVAEIKAITEIYKKCILQPEQLRHTSTLAYQLQLQQQRAELLSTELRVGLYI
jgi:hypothetical protein